MAELNPMKGPTNQLNFEPPKHFLVMALMGSFVPEDTAGSISISRDESFEIFTEFLIFFFFYSKKFLYFVPISLCIGRIL